MAEGKKSLFITIINKAYVGVIALPFLFQEHEREIPTRIYSFGTSRKIAVGVAAGAEFSRNPNYILVTDPGSAEREDGIDREIHMRTRP